MNAPRLDPAQASPQAYRALLALTQTAEHCGLGAALIELVEIRASQINGCAYCIHMHSTQARRQGESEMRLYLLPAWRESSLYTPRERAALAWTEALTRLPETQAPDADYALLAAHFSPREQVDLTLVVTTINSWNRIAVGFRSQHPAG